MVLFQHHHVFFRIMHVFSVFCIFCPPDRREMKSSCYKQQPSHKKIHQLLKIELVFFFLCLLPISLQCHLQKTMIISNKKATAKRQKQTTAAPQLLLRRCLPAVIFQLSIAYHQCTVVILKNNKKETNKTWLF